MRKNVKKSLILSEERVPEDSVMNTVEFIEEAFKMFREMLDNTSPLKSMSEIIFGVNYDFRKEFESQNHVEIVGKVLRASINSFIILD